DDGWVPSIVDVQGYRVPLLRRSPAMPLVPVLKTALRPVYESAGLRWTPPRTNGRMVALLGVIAVFVLGQLFAWAIQGFPGLPSFGTAPSEVAESASPPVTPVPMRRSAVELAVERNAKRLGEVPEFMNRVEAIIAETGGERERAQPRVRALGSQLTQLGMKR